MKKNYIIRKNKEVEQIIKKGYKIISKFFIVFKKRNNLNYNRYCISISKKIGIAVTRNKIKRQIKDILMKKNINTQEDCVIIVRVEILKLKYKEIEKELFNALGGKK